jgi:hypothetical protein
MPPVDGSAAGLRTQILATEHWSLLASRTTTQNEVLARISIFLTLVSATLVSLALVGQATRFGTVFPLFAIAILAFAAIVGLLTQIRVINVSMEDLGYVIAMNRLRAAYASLVPGIQDAFMTSTHDDYSGAATTYYFLGPRRGASQILGSTMVFIVVVNGALVGLLGAAVVMTVTSMTTTAVVTGGLISLLYIVVSMVVGSRPYFRFWNTHAARNPTP